MWLGTVSTGFESSLAVRQGPGEHGRTTKEGCEVSIASTGEGDGGLMTSVTLRRGGYLARTPVGQGVMGNCRFYKSLKDRTK